MASMRDIKRRRDSIQSTEQITKAMKLVATVKLQKSKAKAENSKPYFNLMYETISSVLCKSGNLNHKYLKAGDSPKKAVIVLTSNRGLAGGYNTNLFKCLEASAEGKDYMVLPVGKKAVEYFRQREIEALTEQFAEAGSISVADCFEMANMLCTEFRKGTFGHIELCYTVFNSMLSQQPEVFSMLPMTDIREESGGKIETKNLILYEPDGETVFDAIVPEYLAGLVYGGICESTASELAARRMAMDAATSNAEEMIDQLNLYYNRARQASITQEITEIVAGAEGL